MSDEPTTSQGELITLKNGAIYDRGIGRIVANPGGGTSAITQAQSSAMARTRWDKAAAATRAAIKDVSKSKTSLAAWSGLVAGLYTSAMDDEKPLRDRTIAAKFIGQAADLLPDRQNSQENSAGLTISAHFSPESALQLVQLLDKMRT